MNKITLVTCLGMVLFFPNFSFAQNIIEGNTNSWFLLFNRFQISERWSVTNELHERTGKILEDHGLYIIRPSIDFQLNEEVEFSVGYSFVQTEPYAPYPMTGSTSENNIWWQAMLKNNIGRVNFLHRFRQEHRWIETQSDINESSQSVSDYANRFRYRLTISLDLLKLQNDDAVFAVLFDEIWLTQDDKMVFTDLNRNWLYMGLGYRFSPSSNLQFAYLYQTDKLSENTFIDSPVLQLSFFKNFSLLADD